MFTAPYKLCDGTCSEEKMMMAFPLYIGKSAKQHYKMYYYNDYKKIKSMRPNAPFERKTTRAKRLLTSVSSTIATVTPSTEPAIIKRDPLPLKYRCVKIGPNICYKKRNNSLLLERM